MKSLFYKITGRILAFILLASLTASAAIVPPKPVPQMKLSWDYPVEQMNTNLVFNIYHTTDISVPFAQWTVLTWWEQTSRCLCPGKMEVISLRSPLRMPLVNRALQPSLPRTHLMASRCRG